MNRTRQLKKKKWNWIAEDNNNYYYYNFFAIKHKKILKFLTIIERHISRMSIGLLASIIDQFSDLQKKKITATLSVKPPIPVHTDSV